MIYLFYQLDVLVVHYTPYFSAPVDITFYIYIYIYCIPHSSVHFLKGEKKEENTYQAISTLNYFESEKISQVIACLYLEVSKYDKHNFPTSVGKSRLSCTYYAFNFILFPENFSQNFKDKCSVESQSSFSIKNMLNH